MKRNVVTVDPDLFPHLTEQERAFLALLNEGASPGAATIPGLYDEINRLRGEVARLKTERLWCPCGDSIGGICTKDGAYKGVRICERCEYAQRLETAEEAP